jgi:hypothetical protein
LRTVIPISSALISLIRSRRVCQML